MQWRHGTLIKRYKRFLADVQLDDGSLITAHCTNTGKMMGLTTPGTPIVLSCANSIPSTRRYPYTWEMAWVDNTWVGTNTQWPNRLIGQALRQQTLKNVPILYNIQAEVGFEDSRFDFKGTMDPTPSAEPSRTVWIEVKNVHWRRGIEPCAEFPDCVTTRGARHVHTLTRAAEQGYGTWLIYVIQRQDCDTWDIARDIDPDYDYATSHATGVHFMGYSCIVSPDGITLKDPISHRSHVS